ncbi:hypothetical protein M2222_006182 [Bradyrhizobium elkanii]|jgi:hypothetical protein|nr:hypothetical protein [Bradyrhizobium elkanii]MCS3563860.1 hypothetical protein [Bradyrhizobium elkanii]MCW2146305.1 hypothetical protein [Bradyrhizobium elkanii]MCW2354622.1 hypothetical protein [Bradyrhizobium elkanii]MCW2379135.1 hypothetical protein [Bradyrhizobium elkanii]
MTSKSTRWHDPAFKNSKSTSTQDRLIGNYPSHLRGMATNRYGGNNLQHERGLRGGTYGAAGPARVYTEEQRKQYESDLRHRGELQ